MNTCTKVKIVTEGGYPDQEQLKAFLISFLKTNKIQVTILQEKNSNYETIWNIETNAWTYRNLS